MHFPRALFWACLAVAIAAELLILRASFFPTAVEQRSNIPRSPRVVEMLWGVLPAFALAAVFWAAWQVLPS